MNRATRIIVSTLGVTLGIAGIDHGFFEALQGNAPTPGLFVQAIGPANRMWVYGTEDAFTLVPNFLLTGILAIILSFAIMIWSIRFVHKKNGSRVFILLCILLFLVGGGVAQAVGFILAWAMATQINSPLTWWRKALSENVRKRLSPLWLFFLGIGSLLFLIALEIAIAGFVPGINNPMQKQYICWSLLGLALAAYLLSFIAGFAHDIQAKRMGQE
jgi:hypothetical protein